MAKTFKKEKLVHSMRDEINSFIRTKANDPRLSFVSVTKVELSPDNTVATVYWDTFDPSKRGDLKKIMKSFGGRIRKHIGSVFKMRHVPEVVVVYDSQYEDEKVITDILNDEKKLGRFSDDEEN